MASHARARLSMSISPEDRESSLLSFFLSLSHIHWSLFTSPSMAPTCFPLYNNSYFKVKKFRLLTNQMLLLFSALRMKSRSWKMKLLHTREQMWNKERRSNQWVGSAIMVVNNDSNNWIACYSRGQDNIRRPHMSELVANGEHFRWQIITDWLAAKTTLKLLPSWKDTRKLCVCSSFSLLHLLDELDQVSSS